MFNLLYPKPTEKSEKRGRDQRSKGEIVREGESLREIERPRERDSETDREGENPGETR